MKFPVIQGEYHLESQLTPLGRPGRGLTETVFSLYKGEMLVNKWTSSLKNWKLVYNSLDNGSRKLVDFDLSQVNKERVRALLDWMKSNRNFLKVKDDNNLTSLAYQAAIMWPMQDQDLRADYIFLPEHKSTGIRYEERLREILNFPQSAMWDSVLGETGALQIMAKLKFILECNG